MSMLTGFWKRYEDAPVTRVADGVERRIIMTGNLMMVVVDFNDDPTSKPDPFHNHVHEQVSYVAEGEILLFEPGKEPARLVKGDMFAMPSDAPHAIQRLTKHVRLIDSFTPTREDFLVAGK